MTMIPDTTQRRTQTMDRRRGFTVAALAVVGALALTGCSTVSNEADQVAVNYKGGSLSSKTFDGCIGPATRERNGVRDNYFVYPSRPVDYDGTGRKGSDGPPATIVTVDNAEMNQPFTVTFELNTSCEPITVDGKKYPGGMLQLFHETWGNRYAAFWSKNGEGEAASGADPEGWKALVMFTVATPLDNVADLAAQDEEWKALYNDPTTRGRYTKTILSRIQDSVDNQMRAPVVDGEQQHFFTGFRFTLAKPEPKDKALTENLVAEQRANAEAAAAAARVAVARSNAQALAAEKGALGEDWARKYAIDHGMNPYPNPVVAGTAPQAK